MDVAKGGVCICCMKSKRWTEIYSFDRFVVYGICDFLYCLAQRRWCLGIIFVSIHIKGLDYLMLTSVKYVLMNFKTTRTRLLFYL